MAYEILVQASMDNRALYSVKKCAEIVFKNDRIKKMRIAKTAGNNENLHSNENEIYKFLECEQVEKKNCHEERDGNLDGVEKKKTCWRRVI